MPEVTLSTVLVETKNALRAALRLDEGAAMIEARVLVSTVLALPSTQKVHSAEACLVPEGFHAKLQPLLERRLAHEPMAYITQHREFYGLDLFVNNEVLVPRPETELLVDKVIEMFGADDDPFVADLGTGSGAVAVAIGSNLFNCRVLAIDIEHRALALARKNLELHRLHNVSLLQSDWLSCLPEKPFFDCIVANPPYLTSQDMRGRRGDLAFEPAVALGAGSDGLDAIRRIVPDALSRIKPGGSLLVEHGWLQGKETAGIFRAAGYASIATFADLGGLPRITAGRRPSLS